MVNGRLPRLLMLPVILAFSLACSGGGDDDIPTPAQPTARPSTNATSAPRIGPNATIEPRSGPAGTQVTVQGAGWPANAPLMITSAQNPSNAPPYAQTTTTADGSFTARFRLEKQPDGGNLNIGRFDLVARSTAAQVVIPFQVEVARPVRNPGDGG